MVLVLHADITFAFITFDGIDFQALISQLKLLATSSRRQNGGTNSLFQFLRRMRRQNARVLIYMVSAGHVSPLSKQLPTRVDSLFFKKRREKRMQIFSNSHEHRGMEVISSLFFKDRDTEKIYSLLSAAFQNHK